MFSVGFLCMSVCLPVCLSGCKQNGTKRTQPISMKLGGTHKILERNE